MQAGQLRHMLSIEAPADTTLNDAGNPDVEYSLAQKVWGRIEPLSVTEQLKLAQIAATATHRVTIRYFTGLTHKHRFVFNERIFSIEAILEPELRPIEMNVICREERP